ncbi:MAG: histidine--tRNA ligase [Bacteriovoracia bacterium]
MGNQFLSTQPYKGTRDFYPAEMRMRRAIFGRLRDVVQSFAFEEYDGPMLEAFEIYAAKSGEEIVNNQLYWLVDRGERKLAIRPEMTPTLARMVAAQVNELPKPIRWFSIPNLWRYERPQRGRLREHWQLNVDILGGDPLLADAEIINVALSVMRVFGGEKKVALKLNNRKLVDFFFREKLGLSTEAAHGTAKAVDARAKVGEEAYRKWLGDLGVQAGQIQQMEEFFGSSFDIVAKKYPCAGVDELRALMDKLAESGIAVGSSEASGVVFDPQLFRGLDYYTSTVFEVFDTSPENRRAMFGGGRYDNLVGLFGKHQLSGVGFGMGDVTLVNFLETHGLSPKVGSGVDVFVSLPKAEYRAQAERVARDLREAGLKVMTPLEIGGFGAQLKIAAKHQARYAVLLGDSELAQGQVVLKTLATGEQKTVAIAGLAAEISR